MVEEVVMEGAVAVAVVMAVAAVVVAKRVRTCLASCGVRMSTQSWILPCDIDEPGSLSVRRSAGLRSCARHSWLNQRFSMSMKVSPTRSSIPSLSWSQIWILHSPLPGSVAWNS